MNRACGSIRVRAIILYPAASVNVEASVDVGPEEFPPKKERRKQTGPFTSGLLKPIKATTELAHESIAIGIVGGNTLRRVHVKVGIELGLDVSLADVYLVEVIIIGGGKYEEEAKGGCFDDGGEDSVKINAVLLGVTIGNETSLEFFNGAIGVALDGEHEVAMHDVGTGGYLRDEDHLPCLVLKKATKLTSNCITPICRMW